MDTGGSPARAAAISLEVLTVEAEPLLLVGTAGFVSCRSMLDSNLELFRVDLTSVCPPLELSPLGGLKSPAAYLLADTEPPCAPSFATSAIAVTLGKILIFGHSQSLSGRGTSVLPRPHPVKH